jgi:hypothetical protein
MRVLRLFSPLSYVYKQKANFITSSKGGQDDTLKESEKSTKGQRRLASR